MLPQLVWAGLAACVIFLKRMEYTAVVSIVLICCCLDGSSLLGEIKSWLLTDGAAKVVLRVT